ncbi:MAG: hypothetical protein JWP89_1905 [Schlesneria sp.]|nr:hypothetical protein [Schlesneria sp.]
MKTIVWICVLGFGVASIFQSRLAEGCPQYKGMFLNTYAQEYQNVPQARWCLVCHAEGEDKLLRNNYGDAIATTLIKKNEKDADKFQSNLREVELLPSAIPGKTFGDLIKEGRSPASKK